MKTYIISILALLATSCTATRVKTVEFTFKNESPHKLNWVSLKEAKISPIGGVLSPGVFKTTVDQAWRNDAGAVVTFIEFETQKPHSIPISFSEVNKRIQTGQCQRVVVTILDYDKATVRCE